MVSAIVFCKEHYSKGFTNQYFMKVSFPRESFDWCYYQIDTTKHFFCRLNSNKWLHPLLPFL